MNVVQYTEKQHKQKDGRETKKPIMKRLLHNIVFIVNVSGYNEPHAVWKLTEIFDC